MTAVFLPLPPHLIFSVLNAIFNIHWLLIQFLYSVYFYLNPSAGTGLDRDPISRPETGKVAIATLLHALAN